MLLWILAIILAIYSGVLHAELHKLKYAAQYGSPKCEKNIEALWELLNEHKNALKDHDSRLWTLERGAGMHPPQVYV